MKHKLIIIKGIALCYLCCNSDVEAKSFSVDGSVVFYYYKKGELNEEKNYNASYKIEYEEGRWMMSLKTSATSTNLFRIHFDGDKLSEEFVDEVSTEYNITPLSVSESPLPTMAGYAGTIPWMSVLAAATGQTNNIPAIWKDLNSWPYAYAVELRNITLGDNHRLY